jgi:flagellar biosynthesis protein FliR
MVASLGVPTATEAAVIAGVTARMAAAVAVGGVPVAADVPWRIRAAVVVALAAVAAPAAVAATRPGGGRLPSGVSAVVDAAGGLRPASLAAVLVGEALVGVALGTAVAAVVAAAGWAGRWLATATGLSWADDFSLESASGPPGVARLAWWLGCLGFLAADGHLVVIGGFVDSVVALPVGATLAADRPAFAAVADVAGGMPSVALELALAIGGAALVAVLTFHVAAALCLRTIGFAPGQGMLQTCAAVVMLVVLIAGADVWLGGFGRLARTRIEEGFATLDPHPRPFEGRP